MPIDSGASSTNPAPKPTKTADLSEVHQHAKGERGALWLLLGVVVMAGGTGWLMSDFRSTEQVADSIPTATAPRATAEEDLSKALAEESSPEQQNYPQISAADSADPVKKVTEKDTEAEDASAQKAAKEEAAAQQRAAELSREAEAAAQQRAAELSREAEAAAQQRAAELSREAERIARLKKESSRMERERRTAEKRLAQQHAARKKLERRARLEQKKIAAARVAAKKLANERILAEERQAEAAVKNLPWATSGAYDNAEAGVATESSDGEADLLVTTLAEEKEGTVEFAANPCNGPTARFLSTCR